VLGVFYGTALIADEVDDKTITYLFTRPIPRSAVLFGKFLAYLACTVLLVLPSVVIVFFLVVPIGGGHVGAAFPSLVKDLGMVAVGLASYGSVFAFVGTRLKRPLVAGLVFAFGWEPAVMLFPIATKLVNSGSTGRGEITSASLVQAYKAPTTPTRSAPRTTTCVRDIRCLLLGD